MIRPIHAGAGTPNHVAWPIELTSGPAIISVALPVITGAIPSITNRVPRVAISGLIPIIAMSIPFNIPHARPTTTATMVATHHGVPLDTSNPIVTAARPAVLPMDRSKPPPIITMVWPATSTSSIEAPSITALRLPLVRNWSVVNDKTMQIVTNKITTAAKRCRRAAPITIRALLTAVTSGLLQLILRT